ncbi:hypothetical protein PA42_04290 [Pasteurella canis]|uniref:Uncharacterized protein n=1 Tax=Pasteurella canis TaxID=753 RepID=A0ABQ4VE05_9PAST|nr:hypothetical protein PA42_04290 [Pasteurella canis]
MHYTLLRINFNCKILAKALIEVNKKDDRFMNKSDGRLGEIKKVYECNIKGDDINSSPIKMY